MPRHDSHSRQKIDRSQLHAMYTEQHLTCQEIGDRFGVSRMAVWKQLRRLGIHRTEGTWIQQKCDNCGVTYPLTRTRWKKTKKRYCSNACYWQTLFNPDFVLWRQGSRIARNVVSDYFPLERQHRVHHWDSDQRNNKPYNLAVFATARDHARFERGVEVKPIWNGRLLPVRKTA